MADSQKVDIVLLRESLHGKGPVYVFGDAGVEMWETEATTLSEVIVEAAQAIERTVSGNNTYMNHPSGGMLYLRSRWYEAQTGRCSRRCQRLRGHRALPLT